MNGKAGPRSSKRRSGSAASNSEPELSSGASTIGQAKTDSMSEHSLTSPRKSKYHQTRHSPSPSRAEKGAIGDAGSQLDRVTLAPSSDSQDPAPTSAGQGECGKKESSDFSDPVYQKLSRINGAINMMHKEELRRKLSELHLHTGGVKQVLRKRLKNFYKRQKLIAANLKSGMKETAFDYLIVIDFEATCQENNISFVHEIIEFPAVIIDAQKKKITGMFREFCKPKLNPILTEFCKQLTGVNQAEVDAAADFPVVLQKFEDWLEAKGLGSDYSFAVVTDGPWDIQRFLCKQCEISDIPFPQWGRRWVNVKKTFCNFYDSPRYNLETMLQHLGMQFDGRLHCGLDDSKNIARVVINLLQDGCSIKYNESYNRCPAPPAPPHRPGRHLDTGDGMHSGDHVVPALEKGNGNDHSSMALGVRKKSPHSFSKGNARKDLSETDSGEDVSDLLAYFKLQST